MRSESEFIQHIKSKYSLDLIGDDCAVLPMDANTDLLITSDMLVESIDFRLEWTTPEYLGQKALAVSLSDIAAMGGEPKWALLSLAVSEKLWKTAFLDRFYEGWHALATQYGVELAGGDVSRSSENLVLDCTLLGIADKDSAVRRSGARPGDAIFVTGSLGGAAGGLALLESGIRVTADNDVSISRLVDKQLQPKPHILLGKHLRSLAIVTSMIDISDGLSSDLMHICQASDVGAELVAEKVPLNPNLARHFPPGSSFEMAMNGGEDFELLFTGDNEQILDSGIDGISMIGKITADAGKIELFRGSAAIPVEPKGFRHF